jgi:hypothetical protein
VQLGEIPHCRGFKRSETQAMDLRQINTYELIQDRTHIKVNRVSLYGAMSGLGQRSAWRLFP